MISRIQKNKPLEDEIRHEENIKKSRILLKIFIVITLLFLGMFTYMYYIGIKNIKTNEYILKTNVEESFKGIKMLHFSDLLYKTTINEEDLEKLLEEIKLINPDIVFFTGNLINERYKINSEDTKIIEKFLKEIPSRYGKYAVYGKMDKINFDIIMENANFEVLDNKIKKIYNDKNDFINIVGLNINNKENIKLDNDNYTITLINNYDLYEEYNINSDLVLAGSNLGGEIRLFNTPILGKNKYLNSYYKKQNTEIYISNGLGSTHHMRFMNHPSINIYRLY